MTMNKEIERKYLIKELPFEEMQKAKPRRIIQGYLFLEDNRELRIRKFGQQFFLTQKIGSGLVRDETEEEISEHIFNMMWPFTKGKRLEKLRFTLTLNGHVCEIDVYSGKLANLMVLEVEFSSEEAANNFVAPKFCLKEITEDKRFKNATLAQRGKPGLSDT
ncbi:CYTH domain-containing protein [Alteromonadaceae bacterium Bs31]|nr:CYTH domain-containing protein [Alteromonadaceae bacterium Bs31]